MEARRTRFFPAHGRAPVRSEGERMRTAKQEGGSRSVLLAGIGYAIDAKGCWLRCVWSRTVIVYIEREIYPACSSLYTSLLFCGSDRKDRSRISHVVICPDADAYSIPRRLHVQGRGPIFAHRTLLAHGVLTADEREHPAGECRCPNALRDMPSGRGRHA